MNCTVYCISNVEGLLSSRGGGGGRHTGTRLTPSCINMDSISISDKEQMLNCFNKHFVASGFLFDSHNLACCDSDFTKAEMFKQG